MKVSAILLVSFASWITAHPGLPYSEKVENDSEGVKAKTQENGLLENLRSLGNKFIPLFENGKLREMGIFNIARQDDEKDEVPTSPVEFFFGKDNFIISAISKMIGTAKEAIEEIKSNFQKAIELPFLVHEEKTTGASLGFEKTDSARLKGHESSGKDDSPLSIGIRGIDTNEVKDGYSNGYRKSTEGGAKEVASEKHVIHSTDSPVSSKGNAKTDASEGKHSTESQISAELEEKSASTKKQSYPDEKTEKKLLTGAKENVTEKVDVDEKKDDSKKSRRSVIAY